jgi:hypothetical protein
VQSGQKYFIVYEAISSGGTISELRHDMESESLSKEPIPLKGIKEYDDLQKKEAARRAWTELKKNMENRSAYPKNSFAELI